MAIRITEDGVVIYENEPNVERELFPNIQDNVSPENITQAVNQWLEDHPEATTTVMDGSITRQKLDSELNSYLDSVDSEIGELKENLSDLQEVADTKAAAIYETASGEIASFSDGADDLPLKSAAVTMKPIQDLHGYDNPWPAGGGKNKLPYPFSETTKTVAGITFTDLGDGKIKVNGTATAKAVFFFAYHVFEPIPSGNYILSRNTTVSNVVISIDAYNGDTYVKNIKTTGLTESSFSINYDGYDRLDIFAYVTDGTTVPNDTISLMIRLATETDSTYAPYSNICPISGRTGLTVSHSGADTSDPTTISVNWETEAGTVYGGTLDVVSGKLTVDRAYIASYSGETLPSTWISDRNVYAEGTAPTTGAQVVYKLVNPVEYQLTPQEIRTLLGENNIWSDGGDVEVEYPADMKTYIDTKIAEAVAAAMA